MPTESYCNFGLDLDGPLRVKMHQRAAEFFDEHVSTAKPIGSVSWRTARLGMRKPDPRASGRQ
jgi:hypothetical protein